MVLRKALYTFTSALALTVAGLAGVQAQTTFAEYNNGTGGTFAFSNTTGTLSTTTPDNVHFFFESPNLYGGVGQEIDATLTVSGTEVGNATKGNTGIVNALLNITETFTDDTSKHNVLLVVTGTALVAGTNNTTSFNLRADTGVKPVPQTITYQSNYLTFNTKSRDNYTEGYSLSTGKVSVTNNKLSSFTAVGANGSFSGTAYVPELSSSIGFGGLLLIGGLFRFRRERVASKPA